MKARVLFSIAKLPIILLAATVLTLAGCLITGEAVGDDGLLFFGSLSVDNGSGIIVIPETPRWHYHRLRIAASYYPVQVNRVVIFYRDGGEASYVVGWHFTDRVPYHDLRMRSDRAVREVRIYQSPIALGPDKHGQRKWKGEGGENDERRPPSPVSFRIYGLQ